MAYRSSTSSSASSPSSNNASVNVSPANPTIPLMVPSADEPVSRSNSTRGTPNRHSVDLPRPQTTSKGGCWTCRLRRKKCDEQREGDSCRTCIRLTIECLGWGPKRPDWMRDKQQVDAYKANIKAQLTRQGLIRGQPRASLLQAQAAAPSRQNRPPTYHRFSAPADTTPSTNSLSSSLQLEQGFGFGYDYLDRGQNLLPGVAGASNSSFHQLPGASYSDPNLSTLDLGTSFFQYSPQSTTPLSTLSGSEPSVDFDFSQIGVPQTHGGFDFDLRVPSPVQTFPMLSGQTSMQEDYVMYYFENIRKLHFLFGGNAVANATYSLIVEEPRGALTNAVCAVASLHFSRMRVAQGLEPPNANPEHSMGKSFYDEAYYQLANAKQMHGRYTESDVLAALHLVCFSQISGGMTDWQVPMRMALDWLSQIGLPSDENAVQTLNTMTVTGQLVVKCTMWLDIFSSLTYMRPPKYFALYKRLLGEKNSWSGADFGVSGLNMESLTGCPDEAMLGIAEVSALGHWKAAEQRKGSLSFRELIRRGDEIEKRLREHFSDPPNFVDQGPLHPGLAQGSITEPNNSFVNEDIYRVMNGVFRESVLLYLHTILSDANPAVPEIGSSVDTIVQLLNQLPPSEVDHALIFPICLAGCMTDDSTRRDYLKCRLQSQDESVGNMLRTRLLMEAVWHRRDVSGRSCDWRETMGERGLNLLLV